MRERQIQVLRHCAGLGNESQRRQVPTMRIINREYGAGRWAGLAVPARAGRGTKGGASAG